MLKTKINERSIINDSRVTSFTQDVEDNPPTEKALKESQKAYQLNLIEELFNYHSFLYPIKRCLDIYYTNKTSIEGNTIEPLTTIKEKGVVQLLQISTNFKKQLKTLSAEIEAPEKNTAIQERIKKAVTYFIKHTEEYIKKPLDALSFSTENKEIKKNLNKQLQIMEEQFSYKLYCLRGLSNNFSTEKYLELRAKAVLQDNKPNPKRKEYIDTTEHEKLFDELRMLRMIISQSEDIPPFQVFTQQTLYEMCRYFPVTPKQLRAINGMGKIRVARYGDEIIDAIKNYVAKNDIEPREIEQKQKKGNQKKGSSQRASFDLYKSGLTIPEIAAKRGFVNTTIEGHLSDFIETGEIDITDLIPKKRVEKLKKIIQKTKFESLGELKTKVGDAFSYVEIRMVLKALEFEKNKK